MMVTKTQRIEALKRLKALANVYLEYYKQVAKQNNFKWVAAKTDSSMKALKSIIARINIDLQPSKLDVYCRPLPEFKGKSIKNFLEDYGNPDNQIALEFVHNRLTQVNEFTTLYSITALAPEKNIIHDITWLRDGTVAEHIKIGLGEMDVSILGKYLPSKIKFIEDEVVPYYLSSGTYSEHLKIIKQAILLSSQEDYLSSNVLLITVTESIVRKLCAFVFLKQNGNISKDKVDEYVYRNFYSLDALLQKGEWKNDYPGSLADALTKYIDVNEETLNVAREKYNRHIKAKERVFKRVDALEDYIRNENLSDEEFDPEFVRTRAEVIQQEMNHLISIDDFQIFISLRVMLHFLIRKYKDDRNLIVHGDFDNLNHKWKNFVSFSALVRVYEVDMAYRKFYENI